MTDLQLYLYDLIDYHVRSLDEGVTSAKKLTRQSIESLKAGDWVTVYHATHMSSDTDDGPQNIVFGLDAVAPHYRQYGGGRHAGLFVAPTLKDVKRWGNLIFEIAVRAKNLHGTDWGGSIRRQEWRRKGGAENFAFYQRQYPKSFRPGLTDSLLSTGEPQALLVGLVGPKQIRAVYWENKRYDREEFIRKFADKLHSRAGSADFTSTRMSVDQYIEAMAKAVGVTRERAVDAIKFTVRRGDDYLMDMLRTIVPLGPTVANAMFKKLKKRFG